MGNNISSNEQLITNNLVADDNEIILRTNGEDRIFIDKNGTMAFGQSIYAGQTDKLVLYDDSQPFIRLQNSNGSSLDTRIGLESGNNFQINVLGDREIKLKTNNTNAMIITNDKNVVIGTTGVPETARLWVESTSNPANFPDLKLESSDDNDVFINFKMASIEYSVGIDNSNSDAFTLSQSSRPGGGNNRLTIIGNNIGINQSVPDCALHISTTTTANEPVIHLDQNDSNEPILQISGTEAANITSNISTLTSEVNIDKYINIDVNGNTRWIPLYNTPNPSVIELSNTNLRIISDLTNDSSELFLQPNGTDWNVGAGGSTFPVPNSFFVYGNSAFRMVINNSGNVGIGLSNPSYQLQLSTDSAAKPTTNTWTISSDQRLKENIQNADYNQCYSDIKNLDLKYYKWRDEFIDCYNVIDTHKIGWIADDVEEIYPNAITNYDVGISNCEYIITGITSGFKSLNTDLIYAGMYGALKKVINDKEILEQQVIDMGITINYLLNN